MNNRNLICAILVITFISILTTLTTSFYIYRLYEKNENVCENCEEVDNKKDNNDDKNYNEPTNEPVNSSIGSGNLVNITTFSELDRYLLRDQSSMLVIGKKGCHYCELYHPIIDKVSKEYNLEILYVDISTLSSEDYTSLLDSDIRIPEKCSRYEYETSLRQGFGTPLTLFINKYQSYDCLRGYRAEDVLLSELKSMNIIN